MVLIVKKHSWFEVIQATITIQRAYKRYKARKAKEAQMKPVKPAAAKPVKPSRGPPVLRSQVSLTGLKDKRPMANRPRFVKVDERDTGTRSNMSKPKKFQPGLKTEVEKPSQVQKFVYINTLQGVDKKMDPFPVPFTPFQSFSIIF